MAIIDARILRSLQLTETLSDKGDAQFTGSEDFLILSDTKDPSFADILDNQATWANLGNKRLPRLKDLIQVGGIDLYVNSRDLSHYKDNERAVVMSVRYVGKPEGPGLPEPQLLTPEFFQRWSIQTTSVTEPALGWETLAETNGKPQVGGGQKTAQNSAGDPVDGLEEDTSLLRMTYTNTRVLAPNFDALDGYVNTCNIGFFNIAPGGNKADYTVRCVGYNADFDAKNQVWSVSVEFLYKPNNWSIEYYDIGFNQIVNGKRQAILDNAGNPVSKPVPLNGNGQVEPFSGTGNDEPPELRIRYLYPYPSEIMDTSFFTEAGI
jgi:hypothetical protein